MVTKTFKRKPPSRIRYEKDHPVIPIRVDKETHQKIKAIQDKTGKSLASIIKESLGLQETSAEEAYKKGYQNALQEYKFSFHCGVCKEEIVLSNSHPSVEVIRERLKTIKHGNCTEKS